MSTLHGLFLSAAESFPDGVAVIYDDDVNSLELLTFSRVAFVADGVSSLLENHECCDEVVVLSCNVNQHIPSIIIGILNAPAAFMYVDPSEMRKRPFLKELLRVQHVTHIMLGVELLKIDWIAEEFQIVDSSDLLRQLGLVFLKSKSEIETRNENFGYGRDLAFVMTTSGSTGVPKLVRVPHSSIVPNIKDLSERFGISESDRVHLSSPLTFDPSMVEIFLSLANGATLLITPPAVRLNPGKILTTLQRHNVTVLQATPTFLRRFSMKELRSLLSDVTRLRLLVLGGEKCPDVTELRQWRMDGNRTELWNIYGVTEMSCWASIHKISEYDSEVPLGAALSETELIVRDDDGEEILEGEGTLFLASRTRRCQIVVDEEITTPTEIDTGDLVRVEVTRGQGHGERRLFYRGRRDQQVKRNGKRIDMDGIEKTGRSCPDVDDVTMVLSPTNQITAFVQSQNSSPAHRTDIMTFVNQRVPSYAQIDDVIFLRRIPMTSHGKVDRRKLMELFGRDTESVEYSDERFENELRNFFSIDVIDTQRTFIELGGDSLNALKFSIHIESLFGCKMVQLVDLLLSKPFWYVREEVRNHISHGAISQTNCVSEGRHSHAEKRKIPEPEMKDIVRSKRPPVELSISMKVFSISKCNRKWTCPNEGGKSDSDCDSNGSAFPLDGLKNLSVRLEREWSYDTGKCIDASPLVVVNGDSTSVYIGSHSHTFVALNADDGSVLWERRLGDRIESSACLTACGTCLVVGCYDNLVYFLQRQTGDVIWTYRAGDTVKSSPCVDDVTHYVIVGSHDHHLHAIDFENRCCAWRVDVDGSSVFSSPGLSYHPRHQVYVATLAGTLAAIQPLSGATVWRYNVGKPLFSSPAIGQDVVVVGCVDHCIYAFSHSGLMLWHYVTDGPVFCSPTLVATSASTSDDVISNESTNSTDPTSNASSIDAAKTSGAMTSFITDVYCGSHDQHVYCINNGKIKWRTKLNGIVYSSPFVCDLSTNEKIVFIASNHVLYVLSQSGRVLHSVPFPGEIFSSSAVIYRNNLFIGCRDNNLYCYKILENE